MIAQTLSPSDDALVNTAFPTINFGSLPYLEAGDTSTTYIKFDLTSLPAGMAVTSISKVNLVLWVNRIGTPGSIQVAEAAGPWSESTITATAAPSSGTVVGTATAGTGDQFIYIDVTSSFQKWLAMPSVNEGFVITGVEGTAVYLDSKESVTTSHQPTLQIVKRVLPDPRERWERSDLAE